MTKVDDLNTQTGLVTHLSFTGEAGAVYPVQPAAVPAPLSLTLLGVGLGVATLVSRRRGRHHQPR